MCNVRKHGALLEYLDFMKRHYGDKADDVIADLRKLGRQTKQFSIQELEDLMAELWGKQQEGVTCDGK